MARVAYTVIAQFFDEPTRDKYIAWLRGGHVDQVMQGGAESATIVVLDRAVTDGPIAVEVRYIFSTRDELARYLRDFAPALRADGLARFPSERGVTFGRTVGEIVDRALRGRCC